MLKHEASIAEVPETIILYNVVQRKAPRKNIALFLWQYILIYTCAWYRKSYLIFGLE